MTSNPTLIIAFFLSIILPSCEKNLEMNEVALPQLEEQIVGEWEVKAMKGTATSFHHDIGKVEKDTWTGDSIVGDFFFTDKKDLNMDLKYHRHYKCASWNCPFPKVYAINHQRKYQYSIDNTNTIFMKDDASEITVSLKNRTHNTITLSYCEEEYGSEFCYEIYLLKR